MYRGKLRKRFVALIASGLALAIAGGVGCWLLTFPGVTVSRVSFDTGQYESPARRVSGLLITPDRPVARPAPGVVFVHGFLMSKEVYFGPARELARRGVPVLAIDLRGHGSTGGRGDQNYSEVFDALAAVDYLASLPGVDGDRIAMTGHSRGGVTSARAGVMQEEGHIRAVASVYCATGVREPLLKQYGPVDDFIGRVWKHLSVSHAFDVNSSDELEMRDFGDSISKDSPPNFLLVTGSKDSLTTVGAQEEIIKAATGLTGVVPGYTYGSFENGTARKLVVTDDTHLSEAYSPAAWTAVYDWIFEAFGLTEPAPAGKAPLRRFLFQGMLLLGFILVAAGAATAGRYVFAEPEERWSPEVTPGRRRRYSEVAALCVLCFLAASIAALPIADALGLEAFVPFSFLPFILGPDLMAGIMAGQVLVMLPAFALLALHERRSGLSPASGWNSPSSLTRHALRPFSALDRNGTNAGAVFLGSAPAAYMGVVPFAVFVLLYAPAAYFLHLTRGVPISIGGFFTLAAVLSIYFYVSGHLFHAFALPLWGGLESRKKRFTYVLSEAAVRGMGFGLAFIPVARQPFVPLGGLLSGRTVPLVPAMALIGFFAFVPVSAFALAYRRRGYGVASSSVLMALVIAWIFSTQAAIRFF